MSCNCKDEHECQFGKKGRLFQICNGTAIVDGQLISEELRQKYKDTWKYAPTQHQEGVGTELAKIFAWFWYHEKPGCKCKHYATEMNKNGIEWCKNNIPTIMEWIHEGAKAQGVSMGVIRDLGAKAAILMAIKRAESNRDSAAPRFSEEDVARAMSMIDGSGSKPDNWSKWPHVREAMRRRLETISKTNYHYPNCGMGRGIVTLGGSSRYFACAWILVNVLRRLGCNLPVEWWYTDETEMDADMIALAESLPGVKCREAGKMRGWQAKVHAIMRSRFQEVLFLDADQIPTKDPSYLFDAPEYQQAGSVLWPDLPNKHGCDITEDAFKICNLPLPGRERLPTHDKPSDYRPVESGQILLDKARCWSALNVCLDMNTHADFWYPEPKGRAEWLIYGDKSTFYLAWEMTKTPYVMPVDCDWIGGTRAGAFLQKDFSGEVVFQHRCQPVTKWSLHGDNLEAPGIKHHDLCIQALEDLKSRWIGHPYQNTSNVEFGHWYMKAAGKDLLRVHLQADGGISNAPGLHWAIRDGRMYICDSERALCVLGRDNKSSWVNHTTGNYLMPAPPPGIKTHTGFAEYRLWSEVVVENEYDLGLFMPDDVVIDIGAHCGFFAIACANRGCRQIYCYEPNPVNFSLLAHNTEHLQGVEITRAGIWKTRTRMSMYQPPGAKHSGGHSVAGQDNTGSLFIPLDDELRKHERVRLMKVDCEGSEYAILLNSQELHHVEEICGEWHWAWPEHFQSLEPRVTSPQVLWDHLTNLGFQIRVTSVAGLNGTLGHFWAYNKSKK